MYIIWNLVSERVEQKVYFIYIGEKNPNVSSTGVSKQPRQIYIFLLLLMLASPDHEVIALIYANEEIRAQEGGVPCSGAL